MCLRVCGLSFSKAQTLIFRSQPFFNLNWFSCSVLFFFFCFPLSSDSTSSSSKTSFKIFSLCSAVIHHSGEADACERPEFWHDCFSHFGSKAVSPKCFLFDLVLLDPPSALLCSTPGRPCFFPTSSFNGCSLG